MKAKKKVEKKSEILENKEFIESIEAPILKEIKKPQHVGENLRKIRERKHYTLTEVSEVLRIGARYLEAIEEGNSEFLPERVYTLGFVRAYAQFLGEKPAKCVELFKQQILQENQGLELNLPEALRKSTTPNRLYLIISIGIIAGVLLLIFIINSFSREKEEIPDSTPSDKTLMRSEKLDPAQDQFQKNVTAMPIKESSHVSSLTLLTSGESNENSESLVSKNKHKDLPPEAITKEKNETMEQSSKNASTIGQNTQEEAISLKLSCTEEAWVQIKDAQGEIIFVKTMLPGETFNIPSKKGLILFTGNAGGLNVISGDNISKPLGRKGEVNQHILLDAHSLLPYLNAR